MKRENKNQEIKLRAISGIDDEILERTSKKRFELWGRIKKRNPAKVWVPVVAGAACIALLSGWLIGILPTLGKQIPVYQGMTVSNTYPMAQAKAETENGIGSWLLAWKSEQPSKGSAMKNFPKPNILLSQGTDVNSETETEMEAFDLLGENRALYYAKKNEDIYITIHLKNPEAYEILSFTLNGIKYQSYMFEAGSDSEQLILKVNVGEAQGLTQYTIDAIKYVDGTEIRDVRMEGDRTVTVAVYPEDQPTPQITDLTVDYETVSFDVTIKDTFSLIKDSKGRAWARLYLEDVVIDEQELSLEGATSVTLKGLTPGLSYTLCIMAEYDSMDGAGFGTHWFYEQKFTTGTHVKVIGMETGNRGISFRLEQEGGAEVEVIELINQLGVVERTLNSSSRTVEGLSIGSYTLKITYRYGNDSSQRGYVISDTVKLDTMCPLTEIVKDGYQIKHYSGYEQIYNPQTNDYRSHWGTDVTTDNADQGVYAAFSGTVTEASAGKVTVTSPDGSIKVSYDSLSSVTVKKGDVVNFGQKLGMLGKTRSDESYYTQNHLHLELSINGVTADPAEYFK